ncbi:hypothetical protein STEG23_030071, partial [Scotinomys teguina]
ALRTVPVHNLMRLSSVTLTQKFFFCGGYAARMRGGYGGTGRQPLHKNIHSPTVHQLFLLLLAYLVQYSKLPERMFAAALHTARACCHQVLPRDNWGPPTAKSHGIQANKKSSGPTTPSLIAIFSSLFGPSTWFPAFALPFPDSGSPQRFPDTHAEMHFTDVSLLCTPITQSVSPRVALPPVPKHGQIPENDESLSAEVAVSSQNTAPPPNLCMLRPESVQPALQRETRTKPLALCGSEEKPGKPWEHRLSGQILALANENMHFMKMPGRAHFLLIL